MIDSRRVRFSLSDSNPLIRFKSWKTWHRVKQTFSNLWNQLGGKHINPRIIKEIWRLHVGSSNDYFIKVLDNACKRNTDLSVQLLGNANVEEGTEARMLAIAKMADNFYTLFDSLCDEKVLRHPKQIREIAYNLGQQHAKFSLYLNIMHFDTLNLEMMRELEETGLFDEVDLKSWQRFISCLFECMLIGYSQAKDLIVDDSANSEEKNTTTNLY